MIADATSVYAATNITGLGNEAVSLTDTSLTASALNTLDGQTSGTITATSATSLTGTAAEVATAISASGISTATGVAVTVSAGTAAASDLNTIDSNTTAVVDATAVTTLTGSASQIATAISADGINTATGVGATVSAGSAAATDLNTIDSNTTAVVDATAASTITGLVANVITAIASAGITTATNYSVTLSDASVSVSDANIVDADTTGVVTATISDTSIATLSGLSGTGNAYSITVNDASVDAAALNTLDDKTTVTVNATAVGTLTGTATAIDTAINAASIDTGASVAVTVNSGSATVAQANSIDAQTAGVVTATISDTSIATLSGLSGTGNAYSITVNDASVDAAALNTLDDKTTVTVNAAAVGTLTGTATAIDTAINAASIDTGASVAVTVNSGSATVAQANSIDAQTAGVVTATISQGDLATLANLTGTGNAYTITVTDTTAAASSLNVLDGKTTVAINAGLVATLTGTAADVNTAYSANTAGTISGLGNEAVTITDPAASTLAATALSSAGAATTGTVTVSNAVTVSGTVSEINAALVSANSLVVMAAASTASVSDAATASQGATIAGVSNVTANFSSGISDSLANLASSGAASTNLSAIVADQPNVLVTISDAGGGTMQAADLSAVGSATSGSVSVTNAQTVNGNTDQVIAAVVTAASKVSLNGSSTINASAYSNQDLTGVAAGFILNVTTANGAVLDSTRLATADAITIGAGSATIDSTSTDEVALAAKTTVNNGTTLTVNNYGNTDLSALSNQGTGSIVVNTTTGAVLDEAKLADATSVVLGAAASGAASSIDGIGTNGNRINLNNQTLSVSGYTSENLSGITSAGTLNVTTADGAVLDSTKLAYADAITIGAGTASGTATDVNTLGEERITIATGTALNVSDYTNQELAGFIKQGTGALIVTTADGAVLDATNLADANTITIGAGSATIDSASTDEVALAAKTTVNNGTTLTVNNYVNTDLSALSNQGTGSIVVNTTTGAVLDEAKLADATSVVLGAAASGAASAIDGIGSNGNRINLNNQTLSVSGYTSENLSGITSAGTLNVTTADGAVLDATKLAPADAVTLVGTNTATAADADTLGSRLIGTATLNISTDPITANTDLSDLGSALTLQFGGDTTAVVTGATLSVRQDQVSGYTISGTGTVSAAGTASADAFDASGISSTTNYTSLAGADSITMAPSTLGSVDTIDGGADTDTLIFSAATTSIGDVSFTNVTTTEILQLAAGTNTISLGTEAEQAGIITVTGSTGADTINLVYGSTGLTFNAGSGADTLSYSADSSTQSITLSSVSSASASGTVSNNGTDTFTDLEAIVGGSGSTDLITSTSAAETLLVTGANAGTIDGFTFSGVESVNLSSGNDSATINSGGTLSGSLALGAGTDTLSYAGYGSAVSATLGGANALSSTTAISGGVSGVENVTLSSNNDTFTVANGGSLSGNLDLGSGSDTLSYSGSSSSVTVSLNSATSTAAAGATGISGTVSSFENLVGGSGSDTLNANDGVNSLSVAANGTTTLDTSLTVSGFETINLGASADASADTATISGAFSGTVDLGAGNDTATINDGGSVTSLVGGAGTDTLNLDGANNSITVTATGAGTTAGTTGGSTTFSGFESLSGQGGNDAFTVNSASSSTISLDGGTGTDSLSVAGTDSTANSLTISGSGSGTLGSVSFSGLESITLGSGGDTATVSSGGSLSGNLNLGDGNNSLTFNSGAGAIGSLTSGSGSDTVTLSGGVISGNVDLGIGSNTLLINSTSSTIGGAVTFGSGTSDTLSYVGYGSAVTVSLSSATSASSATGITGSVSGFESLVGGSASDTLNATSGVNSLSVAANGTTTLDTSLTVSGFETINLGASADASADTATISGAFSGTVDLGAGNDTATINDGGSVTSLVGGAGTDTLNLDGANNSITVTATGAGTTAGTTGGSTTFSGFESLSGQGGNDAFTVNSASSSTISLDGGTGTDSLSVAGTDSTANSLTISGSGSGTLGSVSFSGLESITLGSGGDTATVSSGGSLSGNLNLGDGNNSLTFNSGAGAIGSLTSGSGSDTVTLSGGVISGNVDLGIGSNTLLINSTSSTIGGAVTFGSGTSDTLSYVGYGSAVTVSLSSATSASSATGITGSVSGFESLVGGSASDTLNATSGVNSLTVAANGTTTLDTSLTVSGFETINLGASADASADTATFSGAFSGTLDLGAGNDTATINDGGSVTSLVGGTGTDTLNFDAAANSVTLSASGTGSSGSTVFSGFETVNTLAGDDTITLNSAATTTETVDGGNGVDTLQVANSDTSNNQLSLTSGGGGSLGGVSFANIENITLGSGADSVTLASGGGLISNQPGLLADFYQETGTGGIGSLLRSGVTLGPVNLQDADLQSLVSRQDHVYVYAQGYLTAPGSGTYSDFIVSTTSDDGIRVRLDLAGNGTYSTVINNYTTHGDTIDSSSPLSVTAGQRIPIQIEYFESSGGATLELYYQSSSQGISRTLVPLSNLSSNASSATSGFLDLGAGNDSVTFQTGALGVASLSGGTGVDTLNYSSYGSGVTVDLAAGTATGTSTISGFDTVLGSASADLITASTSGDLDLQGNGGNDTFRVTVAGLTSTDSVDGGSGADTLVFTDAGVISDSQFTNVTSVESVILSGTTTLTAGAEASQAGIAAVTTGSGNTTVNTTLNGYDLTIDAASLGDGASLTLSGSATTNDFTVNNLTGSVLAGATSGNLTITSGDAGDNAIGVTTGSGNTTISSSGSSDTITLNADAMLDNTTLDINGSAAYNITNLEANTDAAGSSGSLALTSSDVTDNAATLLTGSGNVLVDGGNKGDTITVTGLSTNNQTFNSQTSTSNFNITAGASSQTITGSNSGNDTIDGGAGTDTLSYAGGSTVDVTISSYFNQAGSSTGQGTDSFMGIESLVGATGTDILRGTTTATDEVATITAANSGTLRDSGSTGSFSFSSFEQLDLQGGNDTLNVTGSTAGVSLSSSVDLGSGNNTFSMAGSAGSITSLSSGSGDDSFSISAGSITGALAAGDGSNTLTVSGTSSSIGSYTGGTGSDSVTLGGGDVGGDISLGSGTNTLLVNSTSSTIGGNVSFGAGSSDTLSYSGYANTVSVNLSDITSNSGTTTSGGATAITGTASGFETLVGGSTSADTLTDSSGDSTVLVSGANSGTIDGLVFSSFENLNLSTGNDTVTVNGSSSGVSLTGSLDLGDGTNNLTMNGSAGSIASVSSGTGDDTVSISAGSVSGAVTAGDGTNSLTISGTSSSIGSYSSGIGSDSVTLSGGDVVGNVSTGTGTDTVLISSTSSTIGGNLDLGTGDSDTLSYAGYSSAVSVTLTDITSNSGSSAAGGATAISGTATGFENLVGGSNSGDTLIDSTGNSTIVISGGNSGTIDGMSFSAIENLNLSSGIDAVTVTTGGSLSGNLNLGDGSSNSVVMNSGAGAIGSLTSGSGNDTITIDGGSVTAAVSIGNGTNSLTINNTASSIGSYTGGTGIDTIDSKGGEINGDVTTGSAADSVTISDAATISGNVTLGTNSDSADGGDTLSLSGSSSSARSVITGSITTGAGADTVSFTDATIGGTNQTLSLGSDNNYFDGDDSLSASNTAITATVTTGSGSDTLTLSNGSSITGNVTLGIDAETQTYTNTFDSASGWTGGAIDSSSAYYGSILGRYASGSKTLGQDVYTSLTLSSVPATISFDVIRLDSWDGESFTAYIRDTAAFQTTFRAGQSISSASGTTNGYAWTITPKDTIAGRGFSGWDDQTATVTITVPGGSPSIKVGFGSTLDQGISDESYAIDNLSFSTVFGSADILSLDASSITGDVVTGSGADSVTLSKTSTITGDLSLGSNSNSQDGADTLTVTGSSSSAQAVITGSITTGAGGDSVSFTDATIGGEGKTLSLGSDGNSLDGNDTLTAAGTAITATVSMGSGADTISLSDGSSITGNVSLGIDADTTNGTIDSLSLDASSITGDVVTGSGADSVTLSKTSTITGDLSLGSNSNSQDGADTLTVTGSSSSAKAVITGSITTGAGGDSASFTDATIGGVGKTLSLGSDGNSLDGNDTLTAAGTAITATVSMGSGADTISLSDGSSITGNVSLGIDADTTNGTIDSLSLDASSITGNVVTGSGADSVTLSKTSTITGDLNLGSNGNSQDGADTLTVTGSSSSAQAVITGSITTGAGGDSVSFTDATIGGEGKTLSLGSDGNSLDGNDTLTAAGTAITATVSMGSGADTISLSDGSSITGNVSLGIDADTTNGTIDSLSLDASSITGDVVTGSGADSVTLGKTSTITGDLSLGSNSNSQDGADTLTVTGSSSSAQAVITGSITTGAGGDSVSFTDATIGGEGKTLSLGSDGNSLDGNDTLTAAGTAITATVSMGSGADTISLSDSSSITGNVSLGEANDLFHLATGISSATAVTGTVAFEAGLADTISYQGNAGPITVAINSNEAGTATSAYASYITGDVSGFEYIVGSDYSSATTDNQIGDSIYDNTGASLVLLTAANQGTINDLDFSSIENLELRSGSDTITFLGSALLPGAIAGRADGGGVVGAAYENGVYSGGEYVDTAADLLDYTSYLAGGITVDLSLNQATGIFDNQAGGLISGDGSIETFTQDSSFENVDGSRFDDFIQGDNQVEQGNEPQGNVLRGFGGADTILGLAGDDIIDGGDGTSGADGADLIAAGDGADLIRASDGSDLISGGGYAMEGTDFFAYDDGSMDTLTYIDENEGLDVSLAGIDKGTVKADAASSLAIGDFLATYNPDINQQLISVPTNQRGTDWTDTYGDIQNLELTIKSDIVRFDISDVNTGFIDASTGSLDTLDYSSFGSEDSVLVNLSDAEYSFDFDANGEIVADDGEITLSSTHAATNVRVGAASTEGGSDGVFGFEAVIGGAADDAIVGNDSDNLLVGNAGDDRIAGGAGADTIYGGTGDDFINPGDGADYVAAGAGINTIAITSSDLAEDFFVVDRKGINVFKLEGDGTQSSSISAPTGSWNPGAQGIDLLDGGDPVVTGTGSSAVTTYDTIYGTNVDDEYELGGTALKNVGDIDLGTGDDYVGTAASTKGIKVNYDGNTGTDYLNLNFTFNQFAKLHGTGKYVLDVQQYLDNTSGHNFSSSQVDFTATNFEAGGVFVISPGVYNMLQGDPAALTFNSAFGARDSIITSGEDVSLQASALTNSTATALSAADIVSAFVEASSVKGSDAISVASGGSITGSTTASQAASALSRTVDDRADSVLAAYGLGTDRSDFTAAEDIRLTLSGDVTADTTAASGGFVVNANGTVEVAGSRDSTLTAGDALHLTISATGLQIVGATNVDGLSIAGLASRAYGIDDADLTDSSDDRVHAGADLTMRASASTNNKVTAQTVGIESLGTFTLVNNGAAATDRFTISQIDENFPLINGDRVRFTSANGSVQADRDYYVFNVIPATGEFQLSSEPDGSPVDVVAAGSLQAYRPATATADAISTVSAVDLNPSASRLADIQSGEGLTLLASAIDQIVATATSVAGDATAGLFRLGGLDNLDLPAAVSTIQALADTNSVAGGDATFQLSATDTASLTASSTDGAALTEGNAQVFGSLSSDTTAAEELRLTSSASLSLSGASTSTYGSAEARSGAGAGAGVTTPGSTINDTGTVQPSAASYAKVAAVDNGSQIAGSDLLIQANATNSLIASASTVSGSSTLGSVWTSAAGNVLATFDLNADTTLSTPSFVGGQYLADGQLVQLPVAAGGLLADTDYAVKLLGFGAVDATADTLTMPTGITYALNDAVRFRLNSTTPTNSSNSRYGIDLGTTYYVANPTGTTFQLSASPNGPTIDLVQDDLGADDQLVDVDRFQLLTPPLAPGGFYTVAVLTPSVSGLTLTLPSVANAFAGSREADLTLSSNDTVNLAQVSGISGNGALRSLLAGAQATITAVADGVINALARNVANDATASAGMVAEGISDTAIAAGSDGSVVATARLNALVDAVTTGDSSALDNSLANLNITARAITANDAANDITIGAAGDVSATASLLGRSLATTVNGDSDALAVVDASGLEALSQDFTTTIGQQGDISAVASIGSLAAPLLVQALSAATGDATAQAASDAVGILGTYNAGVFSSAQAGTSQGDINGSASANLQLRAVATDGAASVVLSDGSGSGSSSIRGIQDMALTAGADLSRISASATGIASLLAQSVRLDASSQGSTLTSGLLSSAVTALPVSFLDQGSIAAIANQHSFSQAISVAGSSSSDLNNRTFGMANATLHFAGPGTIAADALSQQESRAQSVAGNVNA